MATKAELEETVKKLTKQQEEFLKRIIDTTINYDGGCIEGKRDFLKQLGVELPKTRKSIIVDIDACWPIVDSDGDVYETAEDLVFGAISYFCSTYEVDGLTTQYRVVESKG